MRAPSCLVPCCTACACYVCRTVVSRISRGSALIAYCGLFGLPLMVWWIFHEVTAPLMKKLLFSKKLSYLIQWKRVNGSILPASVISLYCMYLCYGGLASEPKGIRVPQSSKERSIHLHWIRQLEHMEKRRGLSQSRTRTLSSTLFSLASTYTALTLTGWSTSAVEKAGSRLMVVGLLCGCEFYLAGRRQHCT